VVIPGFENYLGIYQENALITIIPKDKKRQHVNRKLKKYAYRGDENV
jgi:hypothetical protein